MKRIVLAVCILFVAVTSYGSQDFIGVLNDAPYKIRVPDKDWNGVLVLYAHLYFTDPASYAQADAAPGGTPVEDFLLSRGYALAGSVFRGTGWQVKEGTYDLIALSELFNELVGKPSKRILVGLSMGSLIALKSAEEVPLYDGVIPMCSLGGTLPVGEREGAFAFAYATTFGWPADWGTWYDVRDDLSFPSDVLPTFATQLGHLSTPGDPLYFETLGKFEFIRLLLDLPADGFYAASPPQFPGVFFLMYAVTEVRAEVERKAKGPIYENANSVYSLSDEEIAYLNALGVDAEGLLTSMNAGTTVSIAAPQRHWGERYFEPTGDLRVPVLSVHSTNDHLYPPYFETRLSNDVQSASRGDRFLRVYTGDFGHCSFTPPQLLAAIKAMESWLNTGTKPDPDPSQELSPFHGVEGFLNPATIDPALFVFPIGTK